MYIACLDLEGVLIPEIWIAFSEACGIPELRRTTRDEPDYEKLIQIAKYFNVSVDYLLTGKQTDASAPSQDHLPHTRIQDHELLATYQALSPLSKRRLWDYMQVLKLAERSESEE